jgi:hypothetical protein
MRRDVKTAWTIRDDVRAKLRSSAKRLLVKHKYPPDRQPEAIKLVIEQMEQSPPATLHEPATRLGPDEHYPIRSERWELGDRRCPLSYESVTERR